MSFNDNNQNRRFTSSSGQAFPRQFELPNSNTRYRHSYFNIPQNTPNFQNYQSSNNARFGQLRHVYKSDASHYSNVDPLHQSNVTPSQNNAINFRCPPPPISHLQSSSVLPPPTQFNIPPPISPIPPPNFASIPPPIVPPIPRFSCQTSAPIDLKRNPPFPPNITSGLLQSRGSVQSQFAQDKHMQTKRMLPFTIGDNLQFDQMDEEIISWSSTIQSRIRKRSKNKRSKFKISDIQKALLECCTAINDLEDIVKCVPSNTIEDRYKWIIWKAETKYLMEQVNIAFDFFQQTGLNLRDIQQMIGKRRDKRKRARLSKKKVLQNGQDRLSRRKFIEKRIDENIRLLHEEEQNKLREEKLKKEADSVLKEVRSKQDDVAEMKRFLNVLSSLRSTRMKKGDTHGFVTDAKVNDMFSNLKDKFVDLLSDQMSHYKQEEETLKVMMTVSITRALPSNNVSIDIQRLKNDIHEILFGKEKEVFNNVEEQYFYSSDPTLDVLVQRRRDWDMFLKKEDSEDQHNSIDDSSIPINWVYNGEPNNQWSTYLSKG